MGRTAFTSANRAPVTSPNTSDIPKLKLLKGESSKILLLEDPVTVWYHRLRAPKVINGEVQRVTKESKKGGAYQDYDYEFISAPRCYGDSDVMGDDGVDPKNCPMCVAAKDGMVDAPKRRHAMTIVKYGTKKNGELITPFGASVIAWVFADQQFDRLVTLAEDLAEGDSLRKHDINLGPCSDETFQKFDISLSQRCMYLEMGQRDYITQLFDGNRYTEPELLNLAAWESGRMKVEADLDKIKNRWDVVNGRVAPDTESDQTAQSEDRALSSELSGLLDSQTGGVGSGASYEESGMDEFAPKTEPAKKEPAGALSFDDLI